VKLVNQFRLGNNRGPRLEEVKVQGPKIISIKKGKDGKALEAPSGSQEEAEDVAEQASEQKQPASKGLRLSFHDACTMDNWNK